MARTYEVKMIIRVIDDSTKEVITEEEYLFSSQSFARMANHADKFYELITALQKIK